MESEPTSLWRRGAHPLPATPGRPRDADALVVGAGLTGLVTALLLRPVSRDAEAPLQTE